MKRNSIVAIFLLVNAVNGAYAQSKTDSIYWCRDYRLKWSDFQGIPEKGTGWEAISYTSVKIVEEEEKGVTNYLVNSYFLKRRSWTRDTTDASLLEHERLHFDMAELFARKIRAAIESLKKRGGSKTESYDTVIASILRERRVWGELYDEETDHGLETSKQTEWFIKIQKELKMLEAYSTKCLQDTNTR
jgi:hypothetical protein